ncbi:hypothetical protein DMN91_009217 [Ooceraea biroi]|nr:hypothetical protein DMN91_009217 [Ooceraea biroi]
MREHVVAAAKAMRNGNWSACNNFIINEKMNAKVWDLFYQASKVREMLTRLIKEESLRTYLFTYSHVYDSISMPKLADMFQLKRPIVHSIISKMIINEELMASLDDPTGTVVMHRSEPSRLQSLAVQLTDKVNNFVDSNERIFEMKQGTLLFVIYHGATFSQEEIRVISAIVKIMVAKDRIGDGRGVTVIAIAIVIEKKAEIIKVNENYMSGYFYYCNAKYYYVFIHK